MIGDAPSAMMARAQPHFNIHSFDSLDRIDKNSIEAVINVFGQSVNGGVMDALPNLKIISGYGVGYDTIDVEAAKARGIMVSHTPNVLNADVANSAIMLLLATSRRLVEYDQYVRKGLWAKEGAPPYADSIEGKAVGFVGMGRIGQAIAKRCEVFSMQISYFSRNKQSHLPYRYYDDLESMARDVGYLIVIAPGGAATKHMVNAQILNALGSEGTLINVGRGSIIDEQALITALQTKQIKAAGLDVFEDEPHVPEALMAMDNVVLQPHTASATIETRKAMCDLTVDNVIAFFETGKPIAPVPEMAITA